MIIVTAGHVDHGKTTLIQGLTGTDTDRLPEEKRRGMTIDLGYAFMDINRNARLAFIDVPGHEKFINNMLTGVSHAKHAMLVVACDDGVMPQTREHLDILNLLPLESLTLVLTKCDIATSEQIAATQAELNQVLDSAIHLRALPRHFFAVSGKSRVGIAELKDHLCDLANADAINAVSHGNMTFRMNLDRVFTVKGAGIVATGTVLTGAVTIDDKLYCSGQSSSLRVRSIHAQGRQTDTGKAGERVAVNLVGHDNHRLPARGDWLTALQQPDRVSRVTCVFTGSMTLKHWQSVHCHHGASHCLGRIAYLAPLTDRCINHDMNNDQQHLIELQLDKPLLLTQLDTLVIRDASGQNTLGGARVLELNPPLRGKRKADRLAYLSELAIEQVTDSSKAHQHLLIQARHHGVNAQEFSWNWQLTADAVSQLAKDQQLCQIDQHIIHPQTLETLQNRLLEVVTQYHETHTDELGLGRNRLQRMSHSTLANSVVNYAIDELCRHHLLQGSRGLIHRPQHQLSLSQDEQQIWQKMQHLYAEKAEPLWVSDFSQHVQLEPKALKALCYKLVQLGYLTAVIKDRYVQTASLYDFASKIRAHLTHHQVLETAEFRQLINMGRKVSIQLLELFDRTGFTQRKFRANSRTIRDAEMYTLDDLAEEHRS